MAPPESRARLTLAVRCTLSVLVLGLVGAACLAGCSPESRRRAFVLLFEDTPPGGDVAPAPVVRRPRHPLPPTPTPTPADVAQAPSDSAGAALFSTWDDVLRRLPKDALGNPDWSVALAQRVIAPRPGIAPNAVETDVLALDIELAATSDPAFAVIFSHQQHGAWLACPNCHTDLFEMSARTPPMTAQEAHGETRCGACHGKVAFDVPSGCPLCHLQTLPRDANGDVDWTRAVAAQRITPRGGLGAKTQEPPVFDRDVELTPAMQPALRAVFSHLAHGQWLTCANCHPSLFPTDAAAPELRGADLHSRRYCGACHGTVAFGLTGACTRCHPDFNEPRHHQPALDLDVQVPSKSQPSSTVTFSHQIHSQWLECPICHAGAYGATGGSAPMNSAAVLGGKYCASCHGKVAADLMGRCQPCHAGGAIP